MIPKEKSEELIKIFGDWTQNNLSRKKCALICVEELIKYLPSVNGNPPNLKENEYNSEWWIKVKLEIKKL